MSNINNKQLTEEQGKELITVLKARFEKNMNRHKGLEWDKIQTRLQPSQRGRMRYPPCDGGGIARKEALCGKHEPFEVWEVGKVGDVIFPPLCVKGVGPDDAQPQHLQRLSVRL